MKKNKNENSINTEDVKIKTECHKPIMAKLKKSKIEILIPNGYEKVPYKNPVIGLFANAFNEKLLYHKIVEDSDDIILIYKTTVDKAMNFTDTQGLIMGIHNCMADNQGLIEVKSGETKLGYKYIYSIVKTVKELGGVEYYLRMNLSCGKDIVEINANFAETNVTGKREAMCRILALKAGLVKDLGDENWSQDPYDASYHKGIAKNLAEKEGLDGIFPYNPLTQAHEFILAVVDNLFVRIKNDDSDTNSQAKENKQEFNEKEFLLGLFEDRCRRHTYNAL